MANLMMKPGSGEWEPKRKTLQREADFADISRLYLEGRTQAEISSWLTDRRPYMVSVAMIGRDLGVIRDRWIEAHLVDFDAARARELARVDKLESAYWTGWERSMTTLSAEETETIHDENRSAASTDEDEELEAFAEALDTIEQQMVGGRERKSGHIFERTKTIKRKKEQIGSAVFLQGIEHCIQIRCQILGLNAPTKLDINWKKDASGYGIDPEAMKRDLVRQFVDKAQAAIKDGKDLSMIVPAEPTEAEFKDITDQEELDGKSSR